MAEKKLVSRLYFFPNGASQDYVLNFARYQHKTNHMKKLVLFALLLTIGLTTEGFAQGRRAQLPPGEGAQTKDPAEMIAGRLERLTDALKLTPEQVEQVTVVMTEGAEKMIALRKSGKREEARAQAKVIRDEQDAAIEAVLDKKQLKRYQNYKARRNERGSRGGGRPGGEPRPDGGK